MSMNGDSSGGDNAMDANDEDKDDAQNTKSMLTSTGKRKPRSVVWEHFNIKELGGGFKQAICKYCGHEYPKISSKDGTGNLKRHLRSCPRKKTQDVGGGKGGAEVSEDAGAYDDDAAAMSETHDENDLRVNDQSLLERDVLSTFDNHLSYKLASTEGEINSSKQPIFINLFSLFDSSLRALLRIFTLLLISGKWRYTWTMPALNMSSCNWRGRGTFLIKDLEIDAYYGIKPRLHKHWLESYKASGGSDFHQSKQRSFFSICNSYYDIMHHNKKPFYLKGLEEDSNIVDAYLMHAVHA